MRVVESFRSATVSVFRNFLFCVMFGCFSLKNSGEAWITSEKRRKCLFLHFSTLHLVLTLLEYFSPGGCCLGQTYSWNESVENFWHVFNYFSSGKWISSDIFHEENFSTSWKFLASKQLEVVLNEPRCWAHFPIVYCYGNMKTIDSTPRVTSFHMPLITGDGAYTPECFNMCSSRAILKTFVIFFVIFDFVVFFSRLANEP